MKLEVWKLVEEEYASLQESNPYLNIGWLSLTYNHLPYYLKQCFLYMGAFLEDCEVKASKIIQLWIAEGFIRSIAGNSLEDTAKMHLTDLVERNLFSACKRDCNGDVQAIKVHDVVWRFCQKKGVDEKFLWFKDENILEDEEFVRRVSVNAKWLSSNDEEEIMSFARSFLYLGHVSLDLAPLFLVLRLLRVLDVLALGFTSSNNVLPHLDHLHSLEVLKCSSVGSETKHNFLSNLTFPVSLRKLSLSIIDFESLRPVGELLSLNYLKLQKCEFVDSEWEPVEGEFVELRSLVLENLNLEYWNAGSEHFPRLQHLVLCDCEIQFDN